MDELDLIRSFRADVRPPSAAATARAERAWRRAPGPRAHLTPRRAVAGVLVAAGIAALLVLPGERDGGLGPSEAAAAALRQAADSQPVGLPGPLRAGEFWYFRMRSASVIGGDEIGGYTAIQPQVREEWVAIDGTRRTLVRPAGPLRFPGPRDRERWEAAGSPQLSAPGPEEHWFSAPRKGPFYFGGKAMSYADLLALPRDAAALYGRFRAAAVECECGHSVDNQTFVLVADMLHTAPLPDDLRAALLRAAALIPGIELVPHERDAVGRRGIAVAYDYAHRREALVFDSETHKLLGETQRQLARDDLADGGPGQLLGATAYMKSGVVASRTLRP
jgi:hypothetical protein